MARSEVRRAFSPLRLWIANWRPQLVSLEGMLQAAMLKRRAIALGAMIAFRANPPPSQAPPRLGLGARLSRAADMIRLPELRVDRLRSPRHEMNIAGAA